MPLPYGDTTADIYFSISFASLALTSAEQYYAFLRFLCLEPPLNFLHFYLLLILSLLYFNFFYIQLLMEKLPIEINYKISEYFYKCDKNTDFIFNKFSRGF